MGRREKLGSAWSAVEEEDKPDREPGWRWRGEPGDGISALGFRVGRDETEDPALMVCIEEIYDSLLQQSDYFVR